MNGYVYFSDGKLSYVEDPLGNQTGSEYYANEGGGKPGSVKATYVKEKKADGTLQELTRTTSTYYPNGLLQMTTVQRTTSDASGNPTTVNVQTEYKYDVLGRVVETLQYSVDNPFSTAINEAGTHSTKQTYNKMDKVATTTDKYANVTQYFYDKRGNLVETIYPGGPQTITRTVYDVNNRPIYQQAAMTAPGSIASQTVNFGTHTIYDAFGHIVRTEKLPAITINLVAVQDDVTGAAVADFYNAVFVSASSQVLESTTTAYDNIGRVTKVSDETGAYRSFEYLDAVPAGSSSPGLPARKKTSAAISSTSTPVLVAQDSQDPNGNIIGSSTYTSSGSVIVTTNSLQYDALNRQTKRIVHKLDTGLPEFAKYSETLTKYDALGRRTEATDPDAKVTKFGYDALGRLIVVTNLLFQASGTAELKATYSYDAVGNLVSQTDAQSRVTKYDYDNFGRRIRRVLPGGTLVEKFAYDPPSSNPGVPLNRQVHTDFAGKTNTLVFDARGRVTTNSPDPLFTATAITFTYTPWGTRQTMTDTNGTTTWVYGRLSWNGSTPSISQDSDRLVLKQRVNNTYNTLPASTDALLYDYDTRGNVTRVNARYTFNLANLMVATTDNTRSDVGYSYEGRNRLEKVKDGSSTTEYAAYLYDDAGSLKEATYGPAGPIFKHAYTYNAATQLKKADLSIGGTVKATFDYDPSDRPLPPSGQRKALRQSGSSVAARTVNYDYDTLNRLTEENIVNDSWTTSVGTADYAYDSVGNRLSRQSATALEGKIPDVPTSGVQSFDANDRLSTDTYDSNGNTLRGDLNGSAGAEQTADDKYDFENHLKESARSGGTGTTVKLYYDGDGNRVRKEVIVGATTTHTRYVIDDRTPTGYPQVLEEWKSVNQGAWALTRRYVYGLSRVRQERVSAPSGTDYYGYDGHGNVVLLVSTAGTVTDTYSYDAFGVLLAQTGSTANDCLYSGEQWDADLGMYYLRARYLSPLSGRFWTMDSVEGNPSAPLSLHKYLYCAADPVNRIDPSGNEYTLMGINISTAINAGLQGIRTTGLAVAKRIAINSLYGSIIGGAAGQWDAILGGGDPWAGLQNGAMGGAVFGGLGSFQALQPVLQAIGIGLGTVGTIEAASEGHYAQAGFRGIMTAVGGFTQKYWRTIEGTLERPQSLSNAQARQWYHDQLAKIPSLVDGADIQTRAMQAYVARYMALLRTRVLMRDQQAASGLTPPKTLSGLVEKYSAQGKTGNALWQEIYNSSMRSNPGVDNRFQSGDAAVPFFLWDGSDE